MLILYKYCILGMPPMGRGGAFPPQQMRPPMMPRGPPPGARGGEF